MLRKCYLWSYRYQSAKQPVKCHSMMVIRVWLKVVTVPMRQNIYLFIPLMLITVTETVYECSQYQLRYGKKVLIKQCFKAGANVSWYMNAWIVNALMNALILFSCYLFHDYIMVYLYLGICIVFWANFYMVLFQLLFVIDSEPVQRLARN